jgi:hypothetical protein
MQRLVAMMLRTRLHLSLVLTRLREDAGAQVDCETVEETSIAGQVSGRQEITNKSSLLRRH